jgi:hypothetical protein
MQPAVEKCSVGLSARRIDLKGIFIRTISPVGDEDAGACLGV